MYQRDSSLTAVDPTLHYCNLEMGARAKRVGNEWHSQLEMAVQQSLYTHWEMGSRAKVLS